MFGVEKAKEIVGAFIGVAPADINDATSLQNSAFLSSIKRLRMFAALSRDIGFKVRDFNKIKTFGDILAGAGATAPGGDEAVRKPGDADLSKTSTHQNAATQSIGIDVEEIGNFKPADDYREDEFYRQNFSQREISQCLLQPNPLQSFAGKFCAKEAVIKADNSFAVTPLNRIEILNDGDGAPCFENFSISISHIKDIAVAVAIRRGAPGAAAETPTSETSPSILTNPDIYYGRQSFFNFQLIVSLIAIALSLIAIFLYMRRD